MVALLSFAPLGTGHICSLEAYLIASTRLFFHSDSFSVDEDEIETFPSIEEILLVVFRFPVFSSLKERVAPFFS